MKSKINAIQTESPIIYPFMLSVRCGAKTRRGTACQSPAVHGRKKCRMHGGTNKGAPKGNKNAISHGQTTAEARAVRKAVRQMLKESRKLAQEIG